MDKDKRGVAPLVSIGEEAGGGGGGGGEEGDAEN